MSRRWRGDPATAAGLRSDDLIERIDERSARGLALWEVEALLQGKPGGHVRLLVVRDGKPRRRTIDIVRGSRSPLAPSASRSGSETVVRIPSFGPGTASAVREILAPLDRTRPLVLDLRENAWGSYEEAARTAALFVPAGPLGELKGRRIETKAFRAEPGERVHESRLVLIVDSGTAGPAELFAAIGAKNARLENLGRSVITLENFESYIKSSQIIRLFQTHARRYHHLASKI